MRGVAFVPVSHIEEGVACAFVGYTKGGVASVSDSFSEEV